MEKTRNIAQYQKASSADFNKLAAYARMSLDHIVKYGLGAGYVGFNLTQAGQTVVTVSNGYLFDASGAVYFRDDDGGVDLDFLTQLPAVAGRYGAIVVWAPGEQDAAAEEREFLLNAVTRATEGRIVATENWRQASVQFFMGQENATPIKPVVPSNFTVIGWVLLSNTGIESFEMNDDARLRSAHDAWALGQLTLLRLQAVDSQLQTLGSDLARIAQTAESRADKSFVNRLASELARVREKMDLPDDYIDFGSDSFLDDTESDKTSPGYLALVEEGVRFPPAQVSTIELALNNPADANIVTKAGILLPKHSLELRWRAIAGNSGEMALNSFSYATNAITIANMSRYRTRLGKPFQVAESAAWWKSGKYKDSVRGIFEKGGETFQVLATGEADEAGHKIYRVQQQWIDTVDTPYWTRDSVPQGTTLAGYPWVQTFLMSQDMIVTGVSVPFSRLDSSGPVTFGICEVKADGSPNFDMMLNIATIPYADLSLGASPSPKYPFPPTYLKTGKRYGLVVITAANHWVYVSDQQADAAGTMFFMTGGGYFQADPSKNILIDLYFANFDVPRTEIVFNPVQLLNGIAALDIMLKAIVPDQCSITFLVQVGGIWRLFDPALPSPLATLPTSVPIKAVLLGTATMQPLLQLAGSTAEASRPSTALRHQSKVRTLASTSHEIVEKARLQYYDEAKHNLALKLKIAGSDVSATATTDVVLDDGIIERTSVFMLGAGVTSYSRVMIGETNSASDLFLVSEVSDVAVA